MARSIAAPALRFQVEPLTQEAFSPFGAVIENPANLHESSATGLPSSIPVNQGTALKYAEISPITDFYSHAPSRRPAKPVLNLFVCQPRKPRPISSGSSLGTVGGSSVAISSVQDGLVDVNVLERHPFTSQTFIPLGLHASTSAEYLVIVAPPQPKPTSSKGAARPPPFPPPPPRKRRSLLDIFSNARPSPFTNDYAPPPASKAKSVALKSSKGSESPDLSKLRAFIANGSQAITYAAGTWHAPMIVVGTNPVEFVVLQYSNGIAEEDCEEVHLLGDSNTDDRLSVVVRLESNVKLMKAKL